MTNLKAIETFLAEIKAEGRSSPSGWSWQEFWKRLDERKPPGAGRPLAPLILAASGASNSTKLLRLREQLLWADSHGLSRDALDWLRALPRDQWNRGSVQEWHEDNYP